MSFSMLPSMGSMSMSCLGRQFLTGDNGFKSVSHACREWRNQRKDPEKGLAQFEVDDVLNFLYSGEDVYQQLSELHENDSVKIQAYIPQICNFYLHAPKYKNKGKTLQETLTEMAARDVLLAHHLFWYLEVSLTQNPLMDVKTRAEQLKTSIASKWTNGHEGKPGVQDGNGDPGGPGSSPSWSFGETQNPFWRSTTFVTELSGIWHLLLKAQQSERNDELKRLLKTLNTYLKETGAEVHLPVARGDQQDGRETFFRPHKVVQIPLEYAFTLHSNKSAPFHICVEVVEDETQPQAERLSLPLTPIVTSSSSPKVESSPTAVNGGSHSLLHSSLNSVPADASPPPAGPGPDNAAEQDEGSAGQPGNQPAEPPPAQATAPTPTPAPGAARPPSATSRSPGGARETAPSGPAPRASAFGAPREEREPSQMATASSYASFSGMFQFFPAGEEAEEEDEDHPQNHGIFGELTWQEVQARAQANSPFGRSPGWRLYSVIVKTGKGIRQDTLIAQLVAWFQGVWVADDVDVWLRAYQVVEVAADVGLVETITDAVSIHTLKQNTKGRSVASYFQKTFPDDKLHEAKMNFVKSMAAYSVICFVLAIRDRHNGNILLDTQGHIVHIDFGFALCNAPGGVAVEPWGFKLTNELMDVMGSQDAEYFTVFRGLLVSAFKSVRQRRGDLCRQLEMMMVGEENISLPCFSSGREAVVSGVRERLFHSCQDEEIDEKVTSLINQSIGNWRSLAYDTYQRLVVGIQ
mmetsp:Transcript_59587/g.159430  ORF Transcript_59587/g.159430 Transcript_59587/m.159430 type:complete len:749 (-) Transcript_59587:303-2549(-)